MQVLFFRVKQQHCTKLHLYVLLRAYLIQGVAIGLTGTIACRFIMTLNYCILTLHELKISRSSMISSSSSYVKGTCLELTLFIYSDTTIFQRAPMYVPARNYHKAPHIQLDSSVVMAQQAPHATGNVMHAR